MVFAMCRHAGFRDLKLDIYHSCCADPIGSATSLPEVNVEARDSTVRAQRLCSITRVEVRGGESVELHVCPVQDVTLTINLESSQMPQSAACASELLTTNRCLLTFKGSVIPSYMGYSLVEVPVQFQQYLTR